MKVSDGNTLWSVCPLGWSLGKDCLGLLFLTVPLSEGPLLTKVSKLYTISPPVSMNRGDMNRAETHPRSVTTIQQNHP